jgi:pSer/pThr/pTyr-binding forkhead associated (FHA) protein
VAPIVDVFGRGKHLVSPARPWLLCSTGAMIILPPGSDWVLGRTVPGLPPVEIDLTPLDAVAHGVSRRHARIRQASDSFTIEDLGSHNGSSLNRYFLSPHQTFPLAGGDRVELGTLQLVFVVPDVWPALPFTSIEKEIPHVSRDRPSR